MQVIVIKCGGSVFDKLPDSFYEDIVQLHKEGQWQPVIVHGGGPLISELVNKLQLSVDFVDGLRVTTEPVLDIVEMVLSGSMNKKIVRKIIQAGGQAYGLSGVDGQLIEAIPAANAERLGFVGQVKQVNAEQLEHIYREGYIPVISPLSMDATGQRYNINADTAASAVAKSLQAKLCFISDIPGIYTEENGQKKVFAHVDRQMAEQMIKDEVITGGMIPKVQAAFEALTDEVTEAVILNGMEEHQLLKYCAGENCGTKIVHQLGTETQKRSHGSDLKEGVSRV